MLPVSKPADPFPRRNDLLFRDIASAGTRAELRRRPAHPLRRRVRPSVRAGKDSIALAGRMHLRHRTTILVTALHGRLLGRLVPARRRGRKRRCPAAANASQPTPSVGRRRFGPPSRRASAPVLR